MDANTTFTIKPIGWVESSYEGGPAADVKATIELFPAYAEGAADIKAGDRLMVLFYFDRASEELLTVPLMGNGPLVGVFSSHAPMRPNSIGVTEVQVEAVDGLRLLVRGADMFDGTPVLDLKPVPTRTER
ncbi:MAG: SAM-dependent methyltransferase [Eggerthellaceae bacterium]|nr:SAM-dependent methyltransferase [Eggerthellaceae bacterium]